MTSALAQLPRVTLKEIAAWGRPAITLDDVVRIALEETGRVIKRHVVLRYIRYSRPTPPGRATRNRYENNPHPLPRYIDIHTPVWHPDEEEAIRLWWRSARPGQGVGGGNPNLKKKRAARTS